MRACLTTPTVKKKLLAHPAVVLIGARQCGKTTLARSLRGAYYDLEQEGERLRLDLDWDRLMAGAGLVILDEPHAWPAVFPRVSAAIDRHPGRRGRFLLLESVPAVLLAHVAESLRVADSVVELTPFLWPEVTTAMSLEDLWLCGGYPEGSALVAGRYPRWQLDHLTLLAQRDLPAWGLPARPQTTARLLRMLAAVHGQPWNASQLGQSLGLSYHTVDRYVDTLVDGFLVRRLTPFPARIGKRLVRRPKVYWRDTGLLHALLGVPDRHALLAHPLVGTSWEGFVIDQVIGFLAAQWPRFDAFYFRTSDQHELDLVLELAGDIWAIDVQLTTSPAPDDFERLNRCADLIRASRRFLVCQTRHPTSNNRCGVVDLPGLLSLLRPPRL